MQFYQFHFVSTGLPPGPPVQAGPAPLCVGYTRVILETPFTSYGVGVWLLDPKTSSCYIYFPKSPPLVASKKKSE